jgi:hypothetical protein
MFIIIFFRKPLPAFIDKMVAKELQVTLREQRTFSHGVHQAVKASPPLGIVLV